MYRHYGEQHLATYGCKVGDVNCLRLTLGEHDVEKKNNGFYPGFGGPWSLLMCLKLIPTHIRGHSGGA